MKRSTSLREIRGATAEELSARLQRLESELFQNRMRRATNQLENTMQIRLIRREIARVLTVMSEQKNKQQPQAAE